MGAAQRLGCEHAKTKMVVEFHHGVNIRGYPVGILITYRIHLTGFHTSTDSCCHNLTSIDSLGQPAALKTAHRVGCEAFQFDKKTLKRFRHNDQESQDSLQACSLVKPINTKTIDNDCDRKRLDPLLGCAYQVRGDTKARNVKQLKV